VLEEAAFGIITRRTCLAIAADCAISLFLVHLV